MLRASEKKATMSRSNDPNDIPVLFTWEGEEDELTNDPPDVFIAGDFNDWKREPLTQLEGGSKWAVVENLSPGNHEYNLYVGDKLGHDFKRSAKATVLAAYTHFDGSPSEEPVKCKFREPISTLAYIDALHDKVIKLENELAAARKEVATVREERDLLRNAPSEIKAAFQSYDFRASNPKRSEAATTLEVMYNRVLQQLYNNHELDMPASHVVTAPSNGVEEIVASNEGLQNIRPPRLTYSQSLRKVFPWLTMQIINKTSSEIVMIHSGKEPQHLEKIGAGVGVSSVASFNVDVAWNTQPETIPREKFMTLAVHGPTPYPVGNGTWVQFVRIIQTTPNAEGGLVIEPFAERLVLQAFKGYVFKLYGS